MSFKMREGPFDTKDPKEIMKQRVEKDRFLSSFRWLLLIEFLLAIGYPLVDLLSFFSLRNASSLRDFMVRSLGYSLLCTIITSTVVFGMTFYRLREIKTKPEIRGRRIYIFGLYFTCVLLLLLALVWASVSLCCLT